MGFALCAREGHRGRVSPGPQACFVRTVASAGAQAGNWNQAAPLSAVCFDRGSFMPRTKPALFALLPAGSGGREGAGIVTQLPIQVLVATTMRLQVPQIMSCPLDTGEGSRAGKAACVDLGRPPPTRRPGSSSSTPSIPLSGLCMQDTGSPPASSYVAWGWRSNQGPQE